MSTSYAFGRSPLPVPTVAAATGGTIQGGGNTYYFWLQGKNRAGYNQISSPVSVTVPDNRKINITIGAITQLASEDWHRFIVTASTTSNADDGIVVGAFDCFLDDQVTPVTFNPSTPAIVLTTPEQFGLTNGTWTVATPGDLPATPINGMRKIVSSLGAIYEFYAGSTLEADGYFVRNATGGQWLKVVSNSVNEAAITNVYTSLNSAGRELSSLDPLNIIRASYAGDGTPGTAILFYVINDYGRVLPAGTPLTFNETLAGSVVDDIIVVTNRGYVNLTTFALDTTMTGINTPVVYNREVAYLLPKNLPVGSAVLLSIVPQFNYSTINIDAAPNSALTLYPAFKFRPTTDIATAWDNAVSTRGDLSTLPTTDLLSDQARYVKENGSIYVYDATSLTTADGTLIIKPASFAINEPGRWKIFSSYISAASVTYDKLATDVTSALANTIKRVNIVASGSGTVTMTKSSGDYFYVLAPTVESAATTLLTADFGTPVNNTEEVILVELKQQTGAITFPGSAIFPGAITPTLSGPGKTDLLAYSFNTDGTGTSKLRIYLLKSDIG